MSWYYSHQQDQELTEEAASEKFDYVLMSAGGGTSKQFAPIFEKAGAIVIDNSSQWRMTNDVENIYSSRTYRRSSK